MPRSLFLVTLVVDDYDRAKTYYCDTLGFTCSEDKALTPDGSKRWVVVHPSPPPPQGDDSSSSSGPGAGFLLAKASNPEQQAAVGAQAGGRVGFFLATDDFARDYEVLTAKGVRFHGEPRYEEYGTVGVFEDLYGNKFDLIQNV